MLRILSLECSAKAASAAVFEDGKLLAEEFNEISNVDKELKENLCIFDVGHLESEKICLNKIFTASPPCFLHNCIRS